MKVAIALTLALFAAMNGLNAFKFANLMRRPTPTIILSLVVCLAMIVWSSWAALWMLGY